MDYIDSQDVSPTVALQFRRMQLWIEFTPKHCRLTNTDECSYELSSLQNIADSLIPMNAVMNWVHSKTLPTH